jgi:hypothetical protein
MVVQQVTPGETAGEGSVGTPAISSFARNVLALLERTEYRRCDKGDDLEDVYRLRYSAYRMNDLVAENPDHVVHDPFDDLPNCYRFGVFIDGHLVSTIRLSIRISCCRALLPVRALSIRAGLQPTGSGRESIRRSRT